VFTARYALSPSIKQIHFVFKGLMLFIAKFSDEELTVPQGKTLAVAHEISENFVVSVSDEEDTDECVKQNCFCKLQRGT
jgi:hypothetical protein